MALRFMEADWPSGLGRNDFRQPRLYEAADSLNSTGYVGIRKRNSQWSGPMKSRKLLA